MDKFKGHLELIDQVSHRTAELIHKHMLSSMQEEGVDEIGEKKVTSKKR